MRRLRTKPEILSSTGHMPRRRTLGARQPENARYKNRRLRFRHAILPIAALALVMTGCRSGNNTTSAAAGGMPVTENPVGPVPGGTANISYSTDPYANNAVALADGRRLFNWYNCSGCHGGHGGGGMGPSLRDPVWIYGDRDDQIFNSISQGRSKGMPAWGTKIPESQIWELVAYIKSMGTAQEPDPPIEPSNEEVPNPVRNSVLGVGTQTGFSEVKTGEGNKPHPTEVQ